MVACAAKNRAMRNASDSDSRCSLACDASARDAKSLAMWVERCEPLRTCTKIVLELVFDAIFVTVSLDIAEMIFWRRNATSQKLKTNDFRNSFGTGGILLTFSLLISEDLCLSLIFPAIAMFSAKFAGEYRNTALAWKIKKKTEILTN